MKTRSRTATLVVALACLSQSVVAVTAQAPTVQEPQVPAKQEPTQPPGEPASTVGRIVGTTTVLDGTVRISGVDVELLSLDGNQVLARTMTDGQGQVTFPDVPPGRYILKATRAGFVPIDSAPFDVRAGAVTQVLLDIQLTFVAPSVEVVAPASPTQSIQPVSASDMLAGSVLDIAPLEGDDFQSLLPLLPGVLRGPDGRLRAKGGQPTMGALQVSSASLIDPSSGDFDLQLPGGSIESVEMLPNPFAAEYGRFSTSVTQIRTRRGTNDWEIKPGNMIPRFRKGFKSLRAFEPRFSIRGPLRKDRLFISQDFQYRYVNDPIKSLPGEPDIRLTSFDSFTRVDSTISTRHSLGGLVVLFPRKLENVSLNTFRPPEVTPEFSQTGTSMGIQDRFAISSDMVLESTFAGRWFEIDMNSDGRQPMVYAPESQQGSFFNDQRRDVHSVQWIQALTLSRDNWHGQHLFKFGLDLQYSGYTGDSTSRRVEVRRVDGSLAELNVYEPTTFQDVGGAEFSLFAQDRWRMGSRLTLELGYRMDRDHVVDKFNWSTRGGASIAVLPEGRGILRGGLGNFAARTPLNIGAFTQFERRTVTRFGPDGVPLGLPVTYAHVIAPPLRTPEGIIGNVEWNQRFGRRLLFKANFLKRTGTREYILNPDPVRGEVVLSSDGESRYREFEVTGRYLGGARRDLTVSYVRSHGISDLNTYDQFYGNLRSPILRLNERNLIPVDVPNRLIIQGTIGFPGQWDFVPVVEIRSGFPYSDVNEYQDFIGPRNRAGRLPTVRTLDFALARPWQFKKYRFRAGLRIYNVFGVSAERDVQNNVSSPNYGQFYNPLERSIGFVIGSAK